MSGRININTLGAHPSAGPAAGRVFIYVLASDSKTYYMLNDGVPRTFGVDAHSGLSLDDGTNPHNTTKSDVGLGNVPNVDATQRDNHSGTQLASTISDFEAAVTAYLDRSGAQDNSEQVNTTTSFASRFNVTKTPLHTAEYNIEVNYTWAYDDGGNDFIAELLVNGVVVREHQQEPKDVGGNDGGAGTDQRHLGAMKYKHNASAGVNFDVQLRFRSSSNGVESTIRDSVYSIERFL